MPAAIQITSYTPSYVSGKLLVYATRQVSPGRASLAKSAYRLLAIVDPSLDPPVIITTAYVAKFGKLITGQKIFLRLEAISATGLSSPPLEQSIIVS